MPIDVAAPLYILPAIQASDRAAAARLNYTFKSRTQTDKREASRHPGRHSS
jgi:hypothetical protein